MSNCERLDSMTTWAIKEDEIVRACDINNIAVDLLVSGNFESALTLFAKVLRIATAVMKQDDDKNQGYLASDELSAEIHISSSASLVFQSSVIDACGHPKGDAVSRGVGANAASSEKGAFVYHRVFKLRHEHIIPSLETIVIVTIYNMGIGHHLNKNIASCSQQRLKRAAHCYSRAMSATRNCCTKNGQLPIPPVLRLAILNNLGEVYYQLCNYDKMASVYIHMKKWCRYIVKAGPFLNQTEKYGLLWNLHFLKRPDIAAAA